MPRPPAAVTRTDAVTHAAPDPSSAARSPSMSRSPMTTGRFTHPPESRPLDGYTLKRAIHRGGFGEVYYGLSDGGKEVAMKLLHQHTEVELRGANACLNLNHPNLVTIYDIKRDGSGDWWVLMEYAGGPRLADVLEDRGKLPVEEIEHWLRGMVAGLGFLHERGLVHRDLKPANIFAEGGTVKVGDVGLSKFISESRGSEHTKSVGTVYYMAPEVARGKYGRGVDVYALAVMLFEMYTGTAPFDGETPAEILMKHLSAPPDLSPLPPALRPVFARALHKDPEKRTRSAAELERQFRAAVRGQAGAGIEEAADAEPASFRVPVGGGPDEPEDGVWGEIEARQRGREQAELRLDSARRHADRALHRPEPRVGWISWAALALLVLIFFAPRLARGLAVSAWEVAILAALGYGVFRGVKWLGGGASRVMETSAASPPRPGGEPPDAAAQWRPDGRPVGNVPVRTVPRRTARPVPLGPEDARRLSGWRRATEFGGSAAVAGVLSAAVAGLVLLADAVQTVPEAALFGLVTALASWGVLLTGKLTEGRFGPDDPGRRWRRLPLAAAGALVGLTAWGLGEALLVSIPVARDSLLAQVAGGGLPGAGGLSAAGLSAASLVGSFVWTLGTRRWWRHVDGYRPKRLRVRTVLLTALTGLAGCLLFGSPLHWGLSWAVGVSVVAQLSAVWTPARHRPHRAPA